MLTLPFLVQGPVHHLGWTSDCSSLLPRRQHQLFIRSLFGWPGRHLILFLVVSFFYNKQSLNCGMPYPLFFSILVYNSICNGMCQTDQSEILENITFFCITLQFMLVRYLFDHGTWLSPPFMSPGLCVRNEKWRKASPPSLPTVLRIRIRDPVPF